jgi:phage gp46-like protein
VPIGSRLWLHIERAKLTQATANQAQNDVELALQWMLNDGVAASIVVATEIVPPRQLSLKAAAFQKDGSKIASVSADLWNQVT